MVATIPALKMTHLSLAGLPRCHIFCQFVFAVVTRNKEQLIKTKKSNNNKQTNKQTYNNNDPAVIKE